MKENLLINSQIILEKWRDDDCYVLAEILNNEKMQENLNIPFPYTIENARSFIKKSNNKNFTSFAIKNKNNIIGQISITKCNNYPNSGYLGIWIGINFRGNGFASSAIEYLLKNVDFSEYKEIYAGCSDLNKSMPKVLLKNGFIKTEEQYSINFKNEKRILNKYLYKL